MLEIEAVDSPEWIIRTDDNDGGAVESAEESAASPPAECRRVKVLYRGVSIRCQN